MLERGGNVHLESRVYTLEGPVIIHSNTVLYGEPGTILRVSSSSSQWFTGQYGAICNPTESLQNVEVRDLSIDGNIGNLPRSYSDSRADTDHDCEKLILIGGWSSQFGNNIKIHDLKLYNSFSDAVYVRFTDGVEVYNNIISNSQHEGVYLSCCTNSLIYNNKIAAITSDGGRLDNCVNCKVYDNLFFAYNGDSFGSYKNGANGLQIANTGSSHGYTSSPKPLSTENIEVFNNTFADPGLKAIWFHGGENVFIHDNKYVDASGFETEGFSFDVSPSLETSEKIFTSIFDFLKKDYIFQYPAIQQDFGASAQVTYHNNSIQPHSLVEVQGEDLKVIKYEYAGKVAKHFIERDIWTGEISHVGNELYLPGNFQADKLKITCYGDSGFQNVENIEVEEVKLASASINPDLFIFLAVLAVLGITTLRNLRRIL
jgi:parallel beta-helix repeat protein